MVKRLPCIQALMNYREYPYSLLLLTFVISGCATQSTSQFNEVFNSTKHYFIHVEPCIDRTGFNGSRNIEAEATRSLTEKITNSEHFGITGNAQIVLTCDIERFIEGSALKRWLWPGWGATQVEISVMVLLAKKSKVLSILRSQSSVKSGGLYTIGADSYIIGTALDDIVEQLEMWASDKSSAD